MYISGSLSKLSRLAWAGHDVRLTSPQSRSIAARGTVDSSPTLEARPVIGD